MVGKIKMKLDEITPDMYAHQRGLFGNNQQQHNNHNSQSPFAPPNNDYNSNYDEFNNSMTHSLSLKKIIELSKPTIEKPKLFGLNQIKENI